MPGSSLHREFDALKTRSAHEAQYTTAQWVQYTTAQWVNICRSCDVVMLTFSFHGSELHFVLLWCSWSGAH